MVATDKLFAGSIPEIYDRFLVPLIFEPYAVDLAGRVAALAPDDVLETAAGTGVLTRALSQQLPASTHIVATDLNQPMLDQAARRQPAGTVEWKQADALALPFGDRSFDVVACQFGVMFFPDKVQGYKEARRVLRPDGSLPLQRVGPHLRERVRRRRDAGAGRGLPRRSAALHGAHAAWPSRRRAHPADLEGGRLRRRRRRGRRRPQRERPSARHVAVAYCQGTPLRNEIEARDASRLEEATSRAADGRGTAFRRRAQSRAVSARS